MRNTASYSAFIVLILCMVVAVATMIGGDPASAQVTSHRIFEDVNEGGPEGYGAILDSSWQSSAYPANGVVNVGYTTFNAPSGYHFEWLKIWSMKNSDFLTASSDEEFFTLRFWPNTTDSTSIDAGTTVVRLHEKAAPLWFPIQCKRVSLLGVHTADSLAMRGCYKID